MNREHDLEYEIASTLAERAPVRPPEHLLPSVISSARRKRRWPRWYALVKEPTMHSHSRLAVGSPTARVAAIMAATLLLAILVAGAGIAGARLLAADGPMIVAQDGSGDFMSIAEAVAMAEDGDIILVKPGTYDESVVISKDITILGEGDRDAIVVEVSAELGRPPEHPDSDFDPDLPTAFVLEGADATLEHLTIRGDSSRILVKGGAPVLTDLLLDGLGRICCIWTSFEPTGLVISDDSTARIEDNVILEMDAVFMLGADPSVLGNEFSGGGIWVQGVGVDPLISDNTIDGNPYIGIDISGGARPTISGNTITDVADAIVIQDEGWKIADTGTHPIIRGNRIGGALVGIMLDSGATATIEDNEIADSVTTAIWIGNSEAVVRDNTVRDGAVGITISVGSPTLDGNTLAGNVIGLSLNGGAAPSLSGNVLCGNQIDLKAPGGVDMPDTVGNEISEACPD